MKKFLAPALMVLMAAPLAACGGDGDDALGERAEEQADANADAAAANGASEAVVDNIEDAGDAREEAIDDSDVDADDLTDAQKNAMVGGNTM